MGAGLAILQALVVVALIPRVLCEELAGAEGSGQVEAQAAGVVGQIVTQVAEGRRGIAVVHDGTSKIGETKEWSSPSWYCLATKLHSFQGSNKVLDSIHFKYCQAPIK